MKGVLVLLAMLGLGVHGYIHLSPTDYIRLPDSNEGHTLDSSTYNRVDWNEDADVLYVLAKEPARLIAYRLESAGTLSEISSTDLNPDTNGEPLDVEFCRPPSGTPRLAVSFNAPEDPSQTGTVIIFEELTQNSPDLTRILSFSVGSEPMDMEFGQACSVLLVANRGRPYMTASAVNDPEGTISMAILPEMLNDQTNVAVTSIGFSNYLSTDGILDSLVSRNFRVGPRRVLQDTFLTPAQNIEPVNIIMAPNGQVAYVAMPKNNAVARLSMDLLDVTAIFPAGNRSWANFYMDASKADNAVHMENYPIYSMLMPRQVKWVTQDEADWLITLDSGFINDIPEYNYKDWVTGKQLADSDGYTGGNAQLREKLEDETRLGQAYISTEDGLGDDNNVHDVFMFGGRGITIHDGISMDIRTALVDNLERVSAQFYREVFNTGFSHPSNTPQQDREETSPTTGPNLSVMETGLYQGQKVLFLGSGSSGMIYIYVLVPDADCPQPFFHSVYRRGGISSTWQEMYGAGTIGDLGITDMLYIQASSDHNEFLVVTSATSNSVSVYRVVNEPEDLRRDV